LKKLGRSFSSTVWSLPLWSRSLPLMIIPDDVRQHFLENLIGGLAMNLEGPFIVRLIFHGFVVVVGTLILAGAVNTAIVGSNGVLNRVSEDGVLSAWFRQPPNGLVPAIASSTSS